MSFEALKTPNSPLEKAFEKASKTFSLPSVLPHDVGALQTLLVTQQNAHLAVVQGLHQVVQTAHQEAQEQVQAAHQEAQKQVQAAHQEALAMRAEAQTIRDEAHAYVIRMLEQATLARQRMFGASSEQMSAQSRLFDEAEVLAQNSTDAHDTAPIADEAPQGVPATAAPATKQIGRAHV